MYAHLNLSTNLLALDVLYNLHNDSNKFYLKINFSIIKVVYIL